MEPPTKAELALSCTSREYKRMSKDSKERLESYRPQVVGGGEPGCLRYPEGLSGQGRRGGGLRQES
jgi:hypothetical protein